MQWFISQTVADIQQHSEIIELIGRSYVSTYISNLSDPAVHQFRKAMTRMRLEENNSNRVTQVDESNELNRLPEYRGTEAPPANLPETIELTCNLPPIDKDDSIVTPWNTIKSSKLLLEGIVVRPYQS